jgi:beta-carotene/zeaxanthin 4-ketolase
LILSIAGLLSAPSRGMLIAAGLGFLWLSSLIALFGLQLEALPWWQCLFLVLVRSQLHTGLFIIGHDAMHQVLWPTQPRLNDRLGALALLLYAGLAYGHCCSLHHRHHRLTATGADPDFPDHRHAHLLSWYGQFMAGYLSRRQMTRLLSGWALLFCLLFPFNHSAGWLVLLFCTLPLLLSSWQLFLFGTYLPHRDQRAPEYGQHPLSLDLPVWLSLLACYHFGYHREHHDHPHLAWYQLPAQRRQLRMLTLASQAG